ncbi:hypothetical protein KY284_020273 [Solanum tuberosum]|nr:hypothetical protein KY284_020273 [Solanum tuberosum]
MEGLFVGIDCRGEWVEKKNRYIWSWKDGKKRGGSPSLLVYLGGAERPPILRVYVDENPNEEDYNLEEDQQDMLNDEFDDVDMNNHDDEIGNDELLDFESNNPPTPIVGSNIQCSSQSALVNNVRDDETGIYMGMTFKNKEELANSLKIACLKKDFRLKKCNWWLRAVKFTSSERFFIRIYEKYHVCGSELLTNHNPHAMAKVIGKYFENRFPTGKGPSTRDMSNQLRRELGCKVIYWKIYKGMEHSKSNVRGTHDHGYAVLNAYRYIFEVANPGSKKTLSLDENGRFKYFFVSYAAWITGFQEIRKGKAVNGTVPRRKYEGVLLSAVAQDAENHLFRVDFCIVDKECDSSYEYFFQNLRSFVDDTDELCIIYDGNPSIRKMVSTIYHASHYGCCIDTLEKIFEITFTIQRRLKLLNALDFTRGAGHFSREIDLTKYVNAGNKLLAHQIANYKFSVTGHGDVAMVDLQRRTCTC